MKITAIIAEFNPFHNGHKYIIEKARENGADAIVAVMSGNWVQRGDSAVISKFSRAKQALENGVDLVVELPTYWAMATAQKFAEGAIDIINSLNADTLVFGSECGDITRLMETAYCIRSNEFSAKMREYLDEGLTPAKSREKAVDALCKNGELLRSANDTLAIEYIYAAKNLNSKMKFVAVKRIGTAHNSDETNDIYCSASHLRELIQNENITETSKFMPKSSYDILKDEYDKGKISNIKSIEKMIIADLRITDIGDFKELPDISEGIENRLKNAVRMSSNLKQLMEFASTKRYTNARLRRLILAAFLKERKSNIPQNVPYIRVLGCSKAGADVLQNARKTATKPFIMRSTTLKENEYFKFEEKATEIYSMTLKRADNFGAEYTNGIIIKH